MPETPEKYWRCQSIPLAPFARTDMEKYGTFCTWERQMKNIINDRKNKALIGYERDWNIMIKVLFVCHGNIFLSAWKPCKIRDFGFESEIYPQFTLFAADDDWVKSSAHDEKDWWGLFFCTFLIVQNDKIITM